MLVFAEVHFPQEDDLVLKERLIERLEVKVGIAQVDTGDLGAQRTRDSPDLHTVLLDG